MELAFSPLALTAVWERLRAALPLGRSAFRGGLLGGRYRLERVLGRGGMGEVWLGHDVTLGRPVAVKSLPASRGGADARRQMRGEALAVAAARHPGIVEIHELVEGDEGLFLVFEHLEGRTLRDVLHEKSRLPAAEACRILGQVCEALGFAHEKGLVHRDLKPGNIMLLPDGRVKLLDFGIATAGWQPGEPGAGTPVYMAPEAERGEAGPAADVYALGVCLYEMLVGHRPFSAQATDAHKRAGPPRPGAAAPGVPPVLDELVRRAMSYSPSGRPPTAALFGAVLDAAR
jgi:serine/threonine protein kinase